jgi:hypothetical protein
MKATVLTVPLGTLEIVDGAEDAGLDDSDAGGSRAQGQHVLRNQ